MTTEQKQSTVDFVLQSSLSRLMDFIDTNNLQRGDIISITTNYHGNFVMFYYTQADDLRAELSTLTANHEAAKREIIRLSGELEQAKILLGKANEELSERIDLARERREGI